MGVFRLGLRASISARVLRLASLPSACALPTLRRMPRCAVPHRALAFTLHPF